MAFVHGKDAVVSLDANDISAYTNKCEFDKDSDVHDTTAFGKDSKTYAGGLKDGKVTLEGVYDGTASGPRAIIETLIGTTVELIHKPEGAGSGLPIRTVDVVVKSYKETGVVADMIKWKADLQCSDDVANSTG
jgi:hypothetical protein